MSQDLMLSLQDRIGRLDEALRQFRSYGRSMAQAEREYRTALSQKILQERDKGTPVTIISDVCRGERGLAKLRFERDVTRTMYEAAREACNVYKLEIRILENQIDREYRG